MSLESAACLGSEEKHTREALETLQLHAQAATGTLDSDASQRFITGLRKIEFGSGRYPPGSLLLAQDPVDLNRHAPSYVTAFGGAAKTLVVSDMLPPSGETYARLLWGVCM